MVLPELNISLLNVKTKKVCVLTDDKEVVPGVLTAFLC